MSGMWDHEEAGTFVETLFAKHHGEIYAYLLRMLREPELAADLTQDAFIKAFQSVNRFQGQSSFFTWLYRIAVNSTLTHLRKHRLRTFFSFEKINEDDRISAVRLGPEHRDRGERRHRHRDGHERIGRSEGEGHVIRI